MILPRYPIYIPSKGRADIRMTAGFLAQDGVPFKIVVEPPDYDAYAAAWGEDLLIVTPFQDLGQGAVPVRNFIKALSIAEGHARHWQLDDNMHRMKRLHKGRRIPCNAGPAMAAVEDFTDRYENIALTGINYEMFLVPGSGPRPPFYLNQRVYSCTLVNNAIPHAWRGPYNDDTDLCLQVLADGWCTVLVNQFLVDKVATMTLSGGMTSSYQGDGRLKMARCLERRWPGVVTTDRRFRRPQHIVKNDWGRFDTPLKLKPGVTLEGMQTNEYGMTLKAVKEPKSAAVKALVAKATPDHAK